MTVKVTTYSMPAVVDLRLDPNGPLECKCATGQSPLPNPRCEMHGDSNWKANR